MAYDDQNIFAKILRGEAPAIKVYETEHCLAFLDVMPQTDGHTLVLPKTPAENLYDLDEEMAGHLLRSVQHVARGVRNAFEPDGIRIMQLNGPAAGQTVFHLHMHIVPCYEDQAARQHSENMEHPETLERHAEKIRAALEQIR